MHTQTAVDFRLSLNVFVRNGTFQKTISVAKQKSYDAHGSLNFRNSSSKFS